MVLDVKLLHCQICHVVNQSFHDSCDCYQSLGLWNADIHMSSMHGVEFAIDTSLNLSSDMLSDS